MIPWWGCQCPVHIIWLKRGLERIQSHQTSQGLSSFSSLKLHILGSPLGWGHELQPSSRHKSRCGDPWLFSGNTAGPKKKWSPFSTGAKSAVVFSMILWCHEIICISMWKVHVVKTISASFPSGLDPAVAALGVEGHAVRCEEWHVVFRLCAVWNGLGPQPVQSETQCGSCCGKKNVLTCS